MNLTDQVSRHEIDRHEIEGLYIEGQDIYRLKIDYITCLLYTSDAADE